MIHPARRALGVVGVSTLVLIGVMAGACGKKGAPLPPLRPSPDKVVEVALRRVAGEARLRFTLPVKNADSPTSLSLERIDIYAVSLPRGSAPPIITDVAMKPFLIGSIPVRPEAAPDAPAPKAGAPVDPRPGPGDVGTFSEKIPAGLTNLPEKWPPSGLGRRGLAPAARGPAWMQATVLPATRYYVIQTVSADGKNGVPTDVLALPLAETPESPDAPSVGYDETTIRLSWMPRLFQTYRVYAADRSGRETGSGLPLNAVALTFGEFKTPVRFGPEQCFVVRSVVTRGLVALESDPPSRPACITPVDTFAPLAPTGLSAAAAGDGVVSLTWNAVEATDLAGYVVLRAELPDGALAPVGELVTESTFRDATVKPGTRYRYMVLARDKAKNDSPRSNAVEVTAQWPAGTGKR